MDWLDWLGLLGNLGSLAGFIITVAVGFKVYRLRRHYTYLARAPELRKDLGVIKEMLFSHLKEQQHTRQEVVAELERGKTVVANLVEKIGKAESVHMKRSQQRMISLMTSTPMGKEQLWEVFAEMNKIIERAADIEASKIWKLRP